MFSGHDGILQEVAVHDAVSFVGWNPHGSAAEEAPNVDGFRFFFEDGVGVAHVRLSPSGFHFCS